MSETIKLAEYLFTRLRQLGVGAVHGVPGMSPVMFLLEEQQS
jgi:TPP-dependent 2-oxoacid decarboxylase